MKYKLLIIGRNGVGKDKIAQKLSHDFDLNILCPHTDRPKRAFEMNGTGHIFNSKEEIDKLITDQDVFTFSEAISDSYRYCTTIRQFKVCDIFIMDPRGRNYIKQNFPDEKFYTIYIYISDEQERRERLKRRGDRWEDYQIKCEKEAKIFRDFESEQNWDIAFDNTDALCNTYNSLVEKIKELKYSPIDKEMEAIEINDEIFSNTEELKKIFI